ncbi:cytochrome P450 [Earliella scabrosa]|nr:cytochrome P450 [Earliella scabrosa]
MFATILGATLLVAGVLLTCITLKRAPMPPGPPGLPLIGNLLDMTTHEQWRRAVQWGKTYGDMISVRLFGTPYLFLNSAEAVMDLLHKRGALYSDRPHLTMACDLSAMGDLVPLTKYGERFKLERKLMNQALGLSAVEKWQPIVAKETHLLLSHLVQNPEGYLDSFKRFAGSLIFTTIYGYHIAASRDPYIEAAEEFMEISSYAMTAGWVVDFLPWVRWIPGLTVHKTAASWRAKLDLWVEKPHRMFKDLPDSALKRVSFCGNLLLEDGGHVTCDPEYEHRVKWLACSLYGPGSDTTVITLTMLVLALVHHPEVLRKAQKQLDDAVGTERLPTFNDRSRVPYIDCILKEVLRWGTPVPLTPPHRLVQEDRYRDYVLPEGTCCIANMWAILHNEALYPDPHRFYPERFELEKDPERLRLIDPANYVFGFGRRRCPGLHFADQSLWCAFATIVACFDIAPVVDEAGQSVLPELEFAEGAFRHPKPFRCRIVPRNRTVESLIQEAVSAV